MVEHAMQWSKPVGHRDATECLAHSFSFHALERYNFSNLVAWDIYRRYNTSFLMPFQ
jgi:hypothetical protein